MTTVFQPDDRIAVSRARFEDEPQDVIQIEDDADEAEEGGHILADRRNPRVSADGERNDREVDGERLAETETSFVCVLKDFFRSTFSDHYQAEVSRERRSNGNACVSPFGLVFITNL